MRRTSLRPVSTPHGGSRSSSIIACASSLKKVFDGGSECRGTNFFDDGQVEGRIKVSSTIMNPDTCLSVSYRMDGRFYAVALASGLINVYNSKTDNILYTLHNDDKNLAFTDVSATCVRFRPFQSQQQDESATSLLLSRSVETEHRKKSDTTGSDLEHFLPHIFPKCPSQQYLQTRRRSSVSALGLRSIADELGLTLAGGVDKTTPNNIVTASFTDGCVKTFNFVSEQCVNIMKENREILTMGYSNSGQLLATGGGDGCVYVYDDDIKRLKASYKPSFHYKMEFSRIYSIAFHPESDFEFISGGWDKKIQIYDTRVPNLLVAKLDGPKICGEGLSFHPQAKEFCAAAWTKGEGIQLFDYAMRRPVQNIRGCSSKANSDSTRSLNSQRGQNLPSLFLYAARYLTSNLIVACGSYPGSMAVIERSSGNVIASIKDLKKSVFGIDTCKTKVLLITGKEVSAVEVFV